MSDERRSFPYEPDSVPAVRRYLRERLGDLDHDFCDVVCVMASELATNAIRHGETDFDLRLVRKPDLVRVEITDTGHGMPTERDPLVTEPSGRGLRLVAAMSDRWGVTRTASGTGKTVWFEIAAGPSTRRSAQSASIPRRGTDERRRWQPRSGRPLGRCHTRESRALAWVPWPVRVSCANGSWSAASRHR